MKMKRPLSLSHIEDFFLRDNLTMFTGKTRHVHAMQQIRMLESTGRTLSFMTAYTVKALLEVGLDCSLAVRIFCDLLLVKSFTKSFGVN